MLAKIPLSFRIHPCIDMVSSMVDPKIDKLISMPEGFATSLVAAAFADRQENDGALTELKAGRVYCAGSSAHGAIGVAAGGPGGETGDPRLVLSLLKDEVVQVSCGWRHTVFVGKGGQVWSCGDGVNGKHGQGHTEVVAVPRLVEGLRDIRIVQVGCGQHHSGFISAEGSLYTCGMGLYGQLGHAGALRDEPSPRRVEKVLELSTVACGDLHTIVLRRDGRAMAFGYAANGRLGLEVDPTAQERLVAERPALLGVHAPLAQASEGVVVASVSAGGSHSVIIYSDGSAYTCGSGEFGQLGHGGRQDEARPRHVTTLGFHRVRRASCGAMHT